jgi:serine/threonine protein phosphatase PrpC
MSPSESDPSGDTVEVSTRAISERGMPENALPATRLDFGAASHVGLRRPNNEDHYAVVQRSRARKILLTNVETAGLALPDDEAYVLIVADGMGGQGFGELASELVLRIGWELAGAAPFWVMKFNPELLPKIREKVAAYGRQIQQELREYAEADPELAGMGTTWTCGYVMGSDAIVAHVGDSRAYLYRDGTLRQLTRDHTFAQTLKDVGVPPEETAQYKHLLVNSFGAHPEEVKIDVEHVPLQDGDRLLLCSDGLTDMVGDDEITATLVGDHGAQAACDALIAHALRNGGKDNVTVIVADFHVASAR